MKKSLRVARNFTTLMIALAVMLSFNYVDSYSQENGPTNYCIPSADMVPGNAGMGQPDNLWCYPSYLKSASTYYDYYMTFPILEAKIIETGSGEVKMLRTSYDDGGKGQGPWEGCYVYTGARGEMAPGETYNLRFVRLKSYYGFNGTNYCQYSYTTTLKFRVFIDWNMNGEFEHLTEWVNSPTLISQGKTKKIGNTPDWSYSNVVDCNEQVLEFQVTVSDEQETGVARMRVLSGYMYPSVAYNPNIAQTLNQPGNACWNGYAYDYTSTYGGWYGYLYGEIEDYLIEFSLPFKGSFPSNQAPDDILLAGEAYDGTTRVIGGIVTDFTRPYVKFGQPMPDGMLLTYKIVGPLPNTNNVIYEARDPLTNSTYIDVGETAMGGELFYYIQKAVGPAQSPASVPYSFKWLNGGEYQLVLGLGQDVSKMKFQKKNFNVSWEWDMAAVEITEPLSAGEPRFHKYPRGLHIGLKGVVQNVGLRGVARFDATFEIFNSKGNEVFSRTIEWDTTNFGQYVVPAKQKVNLEFGNMEFNEPDTYDVYLTVKLRSATDMEPYNDNFTRSDQPTYQFSIKDEIEAAARSIDIPGPGIDIIAGRPFRPQVTISNEGVGDISDTPTRLIIRKYPSGEIVYNELLIVQDIPQGRYNIRQVIYPLTAIAEAGQYQAVLQVNHPDDKIIENNEISILFTISSGLIGKYTIGTKFLGYTNNFETIDDALDALYLRGMNGSVTFDFTDAEYTVSSRDDQSPAMDLSTAIMGLGYNEDKGEYWTLTFRPSEERLVTRSSVKINLNSSSGVGILFGQVKRNSNLYSVQNENSGNSYYVPYSNSGGYITFDGGANKSFRFVLNTTQEAFGSVFYLATGSSNISIKNVIMENNKLSLANKVRLPYATYSIVDGFVFTDNTGRTETGWVGYSAGIISRAELNALRSEVMVTALDTMINKNNQFVGNDISGFGYGIVSLGMGPLRLPEIADFVPFYNENTVIEDNKIYNVAGAGIFVGNESYAKVKNNVIYDVKGDGGDIGAGIRVGGNGTATLLGYNNYVIDIDGNSISNVKGKDFAYGVVVEQVANRYQVGHEYRTFPHVDDEINIINNAMWGIGALNATSSKAGIHMFTQRDQRVTDPVTRMVTPNYPDYFITKSIIANNTIMLSEDGIVNNGFVAGVGLQQIENFKLINNAIAVNDPTVSSTNEVTSGVFYHGDYPKNVNLDADKNVYWFGNTNTTAYRHIYTDFKTRIIETGDRNEYETLDQWKMETKTELHSVSNKDFTNDYYFVGNNPQEIKVRNNIKGSVLTRRGDRIPNITEVDMFGNTRGVAGGRYDIGAIEFNGPLFNQEGELITITSPGNYRSTSGNFSDAEYVMTEAPVEIKAIVRNSGNMPLFDKELTLTIERETNSGAFVQVGTPVTLKYNLEPTEYTEISFNSVLDDFAPATYNDLRGQYTTPELFVGMEANVTPLYRFRVRTNDDEYNSNNAVEKTVRFYIMRSDIRFLVSNKSFYNDIGVGSDYLAYTLNYTAIQDGMRKLDWEIDLENARYDYDLFNRSGWEPRSVDYSMYRTLLWSDGDNNTLTRLEKLDITEFMNEGSVAEKKNVIIGSDEMVRNNVNVDDPDEVFVTDILRAEFRFPGNPLGVGADYHGHTLKGVGIGRDLVFDVYSTGVFGDRYPMPALMNIVNIGNGLSRAAFHYNKVQNDQWPDEARIGGIVTSTLTTNLVYLGIDWRHFGDIETVLRASFDFAERNNGVVVPVELLSFDAKPIGKRVDITWATASELNTASFEVEKSIQGDNMFVKIGEMEAAGNSSITRNYGPIVDNAVDYGKTYIYRLKTIDRDGTPSYSDERVVTLTGIHGTAWLGNASPNPVSNETIIEYNISDNSNIEIMLIDANGKEVKKLFNGMQTAGNHNVNIDARDLASGVYQLVLRNGDIVLTTSINIVK